MCKNWDLPSRKFQIKIMALIFEKKYVITVQTKKCIRGFTHALCVVVTKQKPIRMINNLILWFLQKPKSRNRIFFIQLNLNVFRHFGTNCFNMIHLTPKNGGKNHLITIASDFNNGFNHILCICF